MADGVGRWVLEREDVQRLTSILGNLLQESGARSAMLIDRTGQLLVAAGDPPEFETSAFAALTAATFAANDQLAFLVGEREFSSLAHQGSRVSIFLADIERRAVLAILFDHRATLGMVRLRAKSAARELAAALADIRQRAERTRGTPFGRGAASELRSRFERRLKPD